MRAARGSLAVLTLAAFALAARAEDAPTTPARVQPDVHAVVEGNDAFALDLYGKLRGENRNLFFSPNSISTALAMTYAGARGHTAEQMAKALHFTLEPSRLHAAFGELVADLNPDPQLGGKRAFELAVANRLWGQKGTRFLDDFLATTRNDYGAELETVDFVRNAEGARKKINAWVEDRTNKKIQDLLQPGTLTSDTRLVLTNAIYFKGSWVSSFEKEATQDEPFTCSGGEKIQVPMMHKSLKHGEKPSGIRQGNAGEVDLLELPYLGNRLSMVVLLPRKADGLEGVEAKLTSANLASWMASLAPVSEIDIALPRFKLTEQLSLEDALTKCGMKDAFGGSADFSGMTGTRDLYISAVIHKAFVDVNEEGTEAAAATAVVVTTESERPHPRFRADHPFIFMIRDVKTGSVLFLGRLVKP